MDKVDKNLTQWTILGHIFKDRASISNTTAVLGDQKGFETEKTWLFDFDFRGKDISFANKTTISENPCFL